MLAGTSTPTKTNHLLGCKITKLCIFFSIFFLSTFVCLFVYLFICLLVKWEKSCNKKEREWTWLITNWASQAFSCFRDLTWRKSRFIRNTMPRKVMPHSLSDLMIVYRFIIIMHPFSRRSDRLVIIVWEGEREKRSLFAYGRRYLVWQLLRRMFAFISAAVWERMMMLTNHN